MSASPTVTLTLFGFRGAAAKVWAFTQMGLARPAVARAPGLRFWRLVGSGRGSGFSLTPDWGRYGIFAVWDAATDVDAFLDSPVINDYRAHASEAWTVRLRPVQAHGAWGGTNPFTPVADAGPAGRPVAILTRASIRPSKLAAFWSAVPAASRAIEGASGLVASIGIGEAPLVQQATFSLWESEEAMKAFAYAPGPHREVVKRTRDEGWYREDMFARFVPIASEGSWNGVDPLDGKL